MNYGNKKFKTSFSQKPQPEPIIENLGEDQKRTDRLVQVSTQEKIRIEILDEIGRRLPPTPPPPG